MDTFRQTPSIQEAMLDGFLLGPSRRLAIQSTRTSSVATRTVSSGVIAVVTSSTRARKERAARTPGNSRLLTNEVKKAGRRTKESSDIFHSRSDFRNLLVNLRLLSIKCSHRENRPRTKRSVDGRLRPCDTDHNIRRRPYLASEKLGAFDETFVCVRGDEHQSNQI